MASTEFKLDAQRILNHNQPKIINVIKFDELLADCSEQYKNCLNQKYSLLSVMSRDYINLGQLEKQTQELQNDRKLLYQNIITIFQINCLSIPLQVLCEGYEECLTIERTFTQLYQQQRKNGSGLKNHIYFYSDDSTAVYISMLNDIGKIVKVAKNFQDVVPMVENSFQAIGKNIGFIMPEQIAQNHDKILMNCLEKKQLSEEIREYPIILGKDQNGWSFPFHLKIQMCMIGYDELGACGWLKQIVDDNLYLMSSSSSENLQIYLLDYSFYDLIFSQCMSQSDSKKVKLGNIIPLLKQIVNKGIVGKYYEMLVIQPQRFSDVQVDRDKFDENLIRNLMNMNLFQIKLAFFPINNPHCEFVQYQVVSLKPLIEVKQRKEAIRNFQIQMLDIADLDLFDGDIDAGLKLFNLNSESNLAQSDIIFKSNLNKGNSQLNGLNYDKMEEYTGKQESSDQIKERGFHLDLNQVEISTQITRKKSIRLGEDSPMKKQFFDNYVKQIKQNMTQTKIMFSDLNTRSQITKLNSEKSIQSINTILQKPLIENEILLLPAISDTHRSVNIMSQDTQPYFSPLSTNRKGQVFSESAKLILNKVESNILSNPIIENSVEDDLIPSRFQYSQRKLRVSLSDKVNQFNGEATFTKIINQSENQLSEDKKSITQEQKNKDFLDDKDGSTQSSLISKSSAKTNVIKKIRSKTSSKGLRIINIIGILSLVMIIAMNLVSYYSQVQDQKRQKKNFDNIFWVYQLKRFSMLVFGNAAMMRSISLGYYYLPTVYYQKYSYGLVLYTNAYMLNAYRNLTYDLLTGDSSQIDIFNKVHNYKINHTIPNIMNQLKTTNTTTSLTYLITYFSNYFYSMTTLQDKQLYNEVAADYNSHKIYQALDDLYDSNTKIFYDYQDYSEYLIILQLVLIGAITGFFSLLVIPIYAYSQIQREKILKLFATIPSDKILIMMQTLNKYYDRQEHSDQMRKKHQNIGRFFTTTLKKRYTQAISYAQQPITTQNIVFSSNQLASKSQVDLMKKISVSRTNQISRFNFKVIIGLLICLGVNQFYPITNYIITKQQIQSLKKNLYFLNTFNTYYDNITELMNLKYLLTFYIQYPKTPKSTLSDLYTQSRRVRSQTQDLLDNLIKSFSEFENFSGYAKDEYQNYLNPMFNQNICDTIFKSGFNHTRDVQIDQEKCNKLGRGIFTKGLLLTFKYIDSIFDTFFEGALTENKEQFLSVFKQMQIEQKITEEYEFLQNSLLINKVVHYFVLDTYQLQYNNSYKQSLIIISLQMVIIFFVLAFGWRTFFIYIDKKSFQTKQLLDLIDINILLDNPYVISYFNKNI